LAELGAAEKPVLYVFSKIDALQEPELRALQERIRNLLPNSVFVSSLADGGLDPLRRALLAAERRGAELVEVRVPAGDGRLISAIYRDAKVLNQRTEDGQLVLNVRLDKGAAGRLQREGATISQAAADVSAVNKN